MVTYKDSSYAYSKEDLMDLIKKFKNTLEDDRLDNFYRELFDYFTGGNPDGADNTYGPSTYAIGDATKFFYKNGIDVLSLVSEIYPAMFYSETLTEIVIPSHIKSIGSGAFKYSNLEKLEFEPNSQLETIGKRAFMGCSFSGEIILPPSVKLFYITSFANQDNPTVVKYHKGTALSDDYSNAQNITYEEIV